MALQCSSYPNSLTAKYLEQLVESFSGGNLQCGAPGAVPVLKSMSVMRVMCCHGAWRVCMAATQCTTVSCTIWWVVFVANVVGKAPLLLLNTTVVVIAIAVHKVVCGTHPVLPTYPARTRCGSHCASQAAHGTGFPVGEPRAPAAPVPGLPVSLVWPTTEAVRHSIGGWGSAGPIHSTCKSVQPTQALLCECVGIRHRYYYKIHYYATAVMLMGGWMDAVVVTRDKGCCVSTRVCCRFDGGATGRGRVMPHIKSFTRYSVAEGGVSLAWVMTGSHNMSAAAW